LGTGNYNPTTARIYTDTGLLTCNPDFGEDATNLFNLLTGICQFQGTRKLLVAPFELHERMVALIEREARYARAGLPARIIAKMNSLVDTKIIKALYEAARAGVKIELIVRGICCLRPRENVTVRSIVGRFLEHSRIFYFENGCQPEVFVGSADWMPRNFFKRIEVTFPIEDGNLRDRVINEFLAGSLADNVKARFLQPDGTYRRAVRKPGEARCNSQEEFISLSLSRAEAGRTGADTSAKYPRMKPALRPPRP
jgi:polyphosphate kinase